MKDELPKKPKTIECGIINLENSNQLGSHWTAYKKTRDKSFYFDSYGNATPPRELQKYLKNTNLVYNTTVYQTFTDPPKCGHECLKWLSSEN